MDYTVYTPPRAAEGRSQHLFGCQSANSPTHFFLHAQSPREHAVVCSIHGWGLQPLTMHKSTMLRDLEESDNSHPHVMYVT